MTHNEYRDLLTSSIADLALTQGTEDYKTAESDYLDIFRIGCRHNFGVINNQIPDDFIMNAIEDGDTSYAISALNDLKKMIEIMEEEKCEYLTHWQNTYNRLYAELSA